MRSFLKRFYEPLPLRSKCFGVTLHGVKTETKAGVFGWGCRKVLRPLRSAGPVFLGLHRFSSTPWLKTTHVFHEELCLHGQPGSLELEILIRINIPSMLKHLIACAL